MCAAWLNHRVKASRYHYNSNFMSLVRSSARCAIRTRPPLSVVASLSQRFLSTAVDLAARLAGHLA